ncbi:hypothetical protein AAG570_010540 [Ranatra chinensis]|uniref:Uncharacterized protein n=1 Tax=Ranatra chinensis TaxID=642074 RepID=A0ABD0YMU7_9HEMI
MCLGAMLNRQCSAVLQLSRLRDLRDVDEKRMANNYRLTTGYCGRTLFHVSPKRQGSEPGQLIYQLEGGTGSGGGPKGLTVNKGKMGGKGGGAEKGGKGAKGVKKGGKGGGKKKGADQEPEYDELGSPITSESESTDYECSHDTSELDESSSAIHIKRRMQNGPRGEKPVDIANNRIPRKFQISDDRILTEIKTGTERETVPKPRDIKEPLGKKKAMFWGLQNCSPHAFEHEPRYPCEKPGDVRDKGPDNRKNLSEAEGRNIFLPPRNDLNHFREKFHYQGGNTENTGVVSTGQEISCSTDSIDVGKLIDVNSLIQGLSRLYEKKLRRYATLSNVHNMKGRRKAEVIQEDFTRNKKVYSNKELTLKRCPFNTEDELATEEKACTRKQRNNRRKASEITDGVGYDEYLLRRLAGKMHHSKERREAKKKEISASAIFRNKTTNEEDYEWDLLHSRESYDHEDGKIKRGKIESHGNKEFTKERPVENTRNDIGQINYGKQVYSPLEKYHTGREQYGERKINEFGKLAASKNEKNCIYRPENRVHLNYSIDEVSSSESADDSDVALEHEVRESRNVKKRRFEENENTTTSKESFHRLNYPTEVDDLHLDNGDFYSHFAHSDQYERPHSPGNYLENKDAGGETAESDDNLNRNIDNLILNKKDLGQTIPIILKPNVLCDVKRKGVNSIGVTHSEVDTSRVPIENDRNSEEPKMKGILKSSPIRFDRTEEHNPRRNIKFQIDEDILKSDINREEIQDSKWPLEQTGKLYIRRRVPTTPQERTLKGKPLWHY